MTVEMVWANVSRGAPIVGAHDSLSLEVRDDLFDDVADFVDLLVDLFFPAQQVPVGGFFDGGEHVVADIPFIAHPAGGFTSKDAGFGQAVGVMTTAVDRVGDPREVSGEGARHWHVQTRGLVLAGVQLRVCSPRPAGQQGAIDNVVGLGAEVLGHRHGPPSAVPSGGVRAVTARLIVD